MKIKFKLSIIVIAIMAVVVTGIATLLLWQASKSTLQLSLRSQEHLVNSQAEFWKGRENGYIRALTTMANILSDFESVRPEERRDKYDDLLRSALESEPQMVILYTVWKPDALDGLDDQYIGRLGSTPTGQYAMAWSKETGKMVKQLSADADNVMEHINSTNAFKDRITEPALRNINGTDKWTIRMVVPITNAKKNDEEVVGAVGCVLSIEAVQTLLEKTIKENSEIDMMIIYSNQGSILAHYKPERIGKKMFDVDVELGDSRQAIFDAMNNDRIYKGSVYDPQHDDTFRFVVRPIKIGTSDFEWTVLIGVSESHVLKEINEITTFTVILAAIAIIATAAVFFIVLGFVTKPIVKVTETLKDISEGEGDLTRTIPEKGNDEISDMSRYFNRTLAKIKKLIISIKEHADSLSDTGNDLASNMNETASAINEITATIQNIKGRVLNQSASVTQTGATMEQITNNINKLNEYVEQQSASVSQSSSSIEEMLANIQSVTQTLVKNGESVNELTSASELGHTSLNDAADDIHEIARESEGLLKINRVIKDIASQTNLLSMNAAIEAAHAGAAGKGFAVVADEIRKLAESSSEQSKTISTVLERIKGSIDKVGESTDTTITRFDVINTDLKTVTEQEENIRNAMEEQNEGSKQILEAVGKLNEITRQVKDESAQMLQGSREVIRESRNLENVTQEITGGINEIALGAEQINEAVNMVNDITVKNRESINLLVKEVSLFKVE
ncbi:methyl-accepting chemotaxis protein [Treponema sp. R80B11-R83G3]